MSAKFPLWHGFPVYKIEQLANGTRVLNMCSEEVRYRFREMVYRSNVVTVPADTRNKNIPYPQAWHMQWQAWTRSVLLLPTGIASTCFAIAVYLPGTRQLRICHESRRVDSGVFALRLTNQEQQTFVIAERQIGLHKSTVFGGIEKSDQQLPEGTFLY